MAGITTIGKELVAEALPADLRDRNREMDKAGTKSLLQELAVRYPDQYVDVLKRMMDIARVSSTEYGRISSIDLSDLRTPPKLSKFRDAVRQEVRAVQQNPQLSTKQKNERIVAIMGGIIKDIPKMAVDEAVETGNSLGYSVKKGYRGSPHQLAQILFGDMMVTDHRGNPIPIAGLHGYGGGVSPSEYWAAAYGSRSGFIGVQFATAKSGFLGKQIAAMTQRARITGDDCGTLAGLNVTADDPDLMGYVLAEQAGDIPAGTVITKDHLKKLNGKEITVRSVTTCEQPAGICKQCAGQRLPGQFPKMGDFVGINAGRVVSEPFLQLSLGSKHGGAVYGGEKAEISGFDEIQQFLQIPENFKGKALLAPKDGQISATKPAAQGGSYIYMGGDEIYVPASRAINVQPGDKVWAGDVLTSGTPHPGEIAEHKGLGAARRYFTDTFNSMLKRNKVPASRRNVEVLARSFYENVEVTDPQGVMDYGFGDVVPYAELQKRYRPREGAEERVAGHAKGMYLEKPVLWYSIGTRITPEVADTLKARGVKSIFVHQQAPAFKPAVSRIMARSEKDPDWRVRLGGFGLQRSLIDAATKGSSSPDVSTSPVPFLMTASDYGYDEDDVEDTI